MSNADRIRELTEKNVADVRQQKIRELETRLRDAEKYIHELLQKPYDALPHLHALLQLLKKNNIDDPVIEEAVIFLADKKLTGEYAKGRTKASSQSPDVQSF